MTQSTDINDKEKPLAVWVLDQRPWSSEPQVCYNWTQGWVWPCLKAPQPAWVQLWIGRQGYRQLSCSKTAIQCLMTNLQPQPWQLFCKSMLFLLLFFFFLSFTQLHQHIKRDQYFGTTHSKLITEVHLARYYSSCFKSIKAICEDNVLKRLRNIVTYGEFPQIIISTRFPLLRNEIFLGGSSWVQSSLLF